MGSFIWSLIDGKRTIYDIALLVKEKYGDKAEPLYNRLVQYMRNLEDYGFITIVKTKSTKIIIFYKAISIMILKVKTSCIKNCFTLQSNYDYSYKRLSQIFCDSIF